MGAVPGPAISVEKYLDDERAAPTRSEYHDGQVFPLENVTLRQALIESNLHRRLNEKLESTNCRIAASVRMRVNPAHYLYPDLLVYCGQPLLTDEHEDTITNPKLIFEILSPSTTDYDYGRKFQLYRQLRSLEEYVLIAQQEFSVEVFRRNRDGQWVLFSYAGPEAEIPIESISVSLPLNHIYAQLD